ncbi:hypothetical protein YC2023_082330 [Brassica napus]
MSQDEVCRINYRKNDKSRLEEGCNAPIPRRPTGLSKRGLRTRVYSFRQPYVSRYWSLESTDA